MLLKKIVYSLMKKFALLFIILAPLYGQDFGYSYYNITDFRSLGVSYNFQNFSPISIATHAAMCKVPARIKVSDIFIWSLLVWVQW